MKVRGQEQTNTGSIVSGYDAGNIYLSCIKDIPMVNKPYSKLCDFKYGFSCNTAPVSTGANFLN